MTNRLTHLPRYELTRIDGPDGRSYGTALGSLASVTTILSGSRDNSGLEEWRESVGEERAEFITSLACFRGTTLHTHIEQFLLDGTEPEFSFLHTPYWKSARPFVATVERPILLEGAIWHPDGFAGSLDCLAYLPEDGVQPTLLDWKSADSVRKPAKLYEYSLQLAAYRAGANYVYSRHGLSIPRAVLVVAIADAPAQIVEYDANALDQLYLHFKARLERFTFSRRKK